jgi:ribosomal-protein-alanine N-acetyltransferase
MAQLQTEGSRVYVSARLPAVAFERTERLLAHPADWFSSASFKAAACFVSPGDARDPRRRRAFFRRPAMSSIPRLYTPRLCLRAFTPADAARVQELAGNALVAGTTLNVPHPYPEGAAEEWIAGHEANAAAGRVWALAVTLAGTRTPGREQDVTDTGHVVGTMSVTLREEQGERCGELGYWIGVQYWNKGFATEAAHALLGFAFGKLGCGRIMARHFASNPASGRVMQKLGMTVEPAFSGVQRKNGELLEVVRYGMSRAEWMIHGRKPARSSRFGVSSSRQTNLAAQTR